MITHIDISNKVINILDSVYYKNLQKLYPNNKLNELFFIGKFPILKPEYFVFYQYYLIYLFIHHLNHKNYIRYTFSLHFFHIFGLIYDNLLLKYDYKPIYNISYLKNTAYILFIYLFFLKLLLFNKIFLLSIFSIFY